MIPKGKYCENKNYKTCKQMTLDNPESQNSICGKYNSKPLQSEEYRGQWRTIKCKQCLKEGGKQ